MEMKWIVAEFGTRETQKQRARRDSGASEGAAGLKEKWFLLNGGPERRLSAKWP